MKRFLWWCLGIIIIVLALGTASETQDSFTGFGEGVALLHLEGPIFTAEESLEWIERARKNDRARAVVLRVDSPGGAVGASQEIYHALKRLAAEKPLVASFGNVAASGGYYAGMAAPHIFALPGTITASIGVRMSHLDASGLLQFIMLKPDVLKSGEYKDLGAEHRPLRADERVLLEQLLESMHLQFKRDVAASRNLSAEQVDAVADGRVVTGEQALASGLVDAMGDLYDAIAYAADQAGLGDDPEILRAPEPGVVDQILSEAGLKLREALRPPAVGYYSGY